MLGDEEAALSDAVSASGAELDSAALWARYRDVLFGFIARKTGTSSTQGLQLLPEAYEATWDSDASQLGEFANRLSTWGSVWSPQPTLLPDQYDRFLNNIKINLSTGVDPKIAAAFTRAQENNMKALIKVMESRGMCMAEFEQYGREMMGLPEGSLPTAEYEKMFCPLIAVAERNLRIAQGQFDVASTRQLGPYADVTTAVTNFVSDFDKAWRSWDSLAGFLRRARAVPAGKNELTLTFNSKTAVTEKRTFIAKKTRGFLMFRRSRTTNKEELRFRNEFFDMQIRAKGFQALRIAPGPWYDAQVVAKYRSSSLWRDRSMSFFGPSGSMGYLMKTVYVVYQPQVTIRLNKEEGQQFMSAESSSFSFGPFSSQKQTRVTVKNIDQNTVEVAFVSNVDAAYIVAVDHHVLNAA